MIAKEVCISENLTKLERFVQKAYNYKSLIEIVYRDSTVNAKSFLGLLTLGIHGGMTVTLRATGPDETEAIDYLSDYMEKGGNI